MADYDSHYKQAEKQGLGRYLLPLLLLLIYASQCLWFIGTQSLTWDEPIHIKAGLEAWRNHRFEYSIDHPPLARMLATLPVVKDATVEQPPNSEVFARLLPGPESIAWRTRPVIVIFGLLLAGLFWRTARRLFSSAAANWGLALFAFTPALIAHYSIVTTDGIVTLMIFATACQLWRWNRDPSTRQTLLLGIILGLLLLSKMSAPPYFCLALLLVLIRKKDSWRLHPIQWNWKPAATAGAIALLIVWGGYLFHVSHVTIKDGTLTATSPNRDSFVRKVPLDGEFSFLLPAGEYFEALYETIKHNKRGHQSYFWGEISQRANPWYYPAIIVLKWPTILLISSLAGFILLVRRRRPSGIVEFLIFPALTLFLALMTRIGIGERHILAIYPFALLFCAALWEMGLPSRLKFRWISSSRTGSLLIALAVLNGVDALRAAPGYLSYFNVAVRPERAFRIVTDSNIDWGQGLLALRHFIARHPERTFYFANFGNVELSNYGIRALLLTPGTRRTGTIVVSASNLSGQYLEKDPDGYKWLLQYPIETVLNGNLYVFAVPQ